MAYLARPHKATCAAGPPNVGFLQMGVPSCGGEFRASPARTMLVAYSLIAPILATI